MGKDQDITTSFVLTNWFKWRSGQLVDLIFPPVCLSCGKNGYWWCNNCQIDIKPLELGWCGFCGRKSKPDRTVCKKCTKRTGVSRVVGCFAYEGEIEQIIKSIKFKPAEIGLKVVNNHPHVQCMLNNFFEIPLNPPFSKGEGHLLKRRYPPLWKRGVRGDFINKSNSNHLLIPIPMDVERLEKRGFNQAYEWARLISKQFNVKISEKLVRAKESESQIGKSAYERSKNVEQIFAWRGENLKNKIVTIVDDVATTGATVYNATKALRAAGCRNISALVLAQTHLTHKQRKLWRGS